jgi:hypothetical protein
LKTQQAKKPAVNPKKNKRSRQHHYLPVFYQSRFGDSQGLVWRFDLEERAGKRLHPTVSLVIGDFNTIQTDEGLSDDVEKGLAEIDGMAATALRRVDEGFWPVCGETRYAISLFMAFQLTRGPRFRAQMDHFAHEATSLMMKVQASRPDAVRNQLKKRNGKEPSDKEVRQEIEELKTFGDRFKVSQSRQSHVRTMLGVQESGQLASILFKRAWSLEISENLDFITSDDPVVLWKKNLRSWEGIGAATADEVRFPLSPRICLVMHHPWVPVPDEVEVGPRRVLSVNAWTILNANRYVVSKGTMTNFVEYTSNATNVRMEQVHGN